MPSLIVTELDPHVNPPALHVAARACKPFKSQVPGARAGDHEGHDNGSQWSRATGGQTQRQQGPRTTGPGLESKGGRDHGARARKQGPRGPVPEITGARHQRYPRTSHRIRQPKKRYTVAQKTVDDQKKEVCSCAENGRPEKREVCNCAESSRPKRKDHKSTIKVL